MRRACARVLSPRSFFFRGSLLIKEEKTEGRGALVSTFPAKGRPRRCLQIRRRRRGAVLDFLSVWPRARAEQVCGRPLALAPSHHRHDPVAAACRRRRHHPHLRHELRRPRGPSESAQPTRGRGARGAADTGRRAAQGLEGSAKKGKYIKAKHVHTELCACSSEATFADGNEVAKAFQVIRVFRVNLLVEFEGFLVVVHSPVAAGDHQAPFHLSTRGLGNMHTSYSQTPP